MTERFNPHIPTREEVKAALARVSIMDVDLEAEIKQAEIIQFPVKVEPPDIAA